MRSTRPSVSYFPVAPAEQALLLRVRESDLAGRLDDLLEWVDLLAGGTLSPANLAVAVEQFEASRQGEGMDARFANLEARLKERIDRGLAEIEGRLSRRVADNVEQADEPVEVVVVAEGADEVPEAASMAVRIGSELVWGPSAAQFYVAVWRWLLEHGHVRVADLPIGTTQKKRFVAATAPVHPTGKAFFRPEEPIPGVFVEVNMSRDNILSRTRQLLNRYGVAHEVVVGSHAG